MRLDQIAFKVEPGGLFTDHMKLVEGIYGLDPDRWIHDIVIAKGFVYPYEGELVNQAHLAFNYSGELEIEVIQYLDGKNFHELLMGSISHFGMHMRDDEEFNEQYIKLQKNFMLVQQVTTLVHTNEYLVQNGRKYEYAIYDTRSKVGAFTKLIRRINP